MAGANPDRHLRSCRVAARCPPDRRPRRPLGLPSEWGPGKPSRFGIRRHSGLVHRRVTVHKPDAQAKGTLLCKTTSRNKRLHEWLGVGQEKEYPDDAEKERALDPIPLHEPEVVTQLWVAKQAMGNRIDT